MAKPKGIVVVTCRIFALLVACGIACAVAADPVDLHALYPAGSIDSLTRADSAVLAVQKERDRGNAEYLQGQRACYKKFLANSCLIDLKAEHRVNDELLDAIQTEANRFKREAHGREIAAQRAQNAAQKAASADQDEASRSKKSAQFQQNQDDARDNLVKRDVHAEGDAGRAAASGAQSKATEQRLAREHQEALDSEKARVQNEKDYAQKQENAKERRERVAKKQAEKDADRKRRADSAAATAAATAAASGAAKPAVATPKPSPAPASSPAPAPAALSQTSATPPKP